MLFVLGVACGLAVAVWWPEVKEEEELDLRVAENDFVRDIYDRAGGSHYPHVLEDGTVRWYRVDDEYAVHL